MRSPDPSCSTTCNGCPVPQQWNPAMNDASGYTPPKVWKWNKENGGRFASINRPIAGPTHDKELPVGKHPLQLYSLATPNGVKRSEAPPSELPSLIPTSYAVFSFQTKKFSPS